MNGRNYNYRRSSYRKKRIKLIAAIAAVVLALALLLLFIIGTVLNSKNSTYSGKPTPDDGTQTDNDTGTLASVPRIKGRPLTLLTQDSSTLASRLSALPKGTEAVCVRLNEENGTLLYNSSVAKELSSFSIAENASRAENAFGIIQRNGHYISAVLTLTSLSEDDTLLREVGISAYISIAAEAALAGADDVLLMLPDNIDALQGEALGNLTDELCSIAERIRRLVPTAKLGFALDGRILLAGNSSELVNLLSTSFNYLAIDATEYGKQDAVEYLEEMIGSGGNADMQYYLLRYGMRVLLPKLEDEAVHEELISVVEAYSSNNGNWQFLP